MTRLVTIAAALLLLATGCTSPTADGTEDGKPLASRSSTAPTTTEPVAPEYAEPAKTDFELTVKTLDKECFGSAGCIVTFRVDLAYGGRPLDPDKTYLVTYALKGGEDERIATLEVTGDSYEHEEEETIDTKSSKVKLRAVVTEVEES